MITTLIGGLGAGRFCLMLSAAAAAFLLIPPLTLLLFVLLAIFSVILITRMRLAIQREQAAQALQASKDRLQLALDTAQLGWWRYDPRRRVIAGDNRFKEVFDVPATKCRSMISGSWCIRTTRRGVGRTATHRSPSIHALTPARVPGSATKWRGPLGRGAAACVFRGQSA
jgi:PAS domain-containing protein